MSDFCFPTDVSGSSVVMCAFLLCVLLCLTPGLKSLSASAPPQGCLLGVRSPWERERKREGEMERERERWRERGRDGERLVKFHIFVGHRG